MQCFLQKKSRQVDQGTFVRTDALLAAGED
jgi:hypothetical protein